MWSRVVVRVELLFSSKTRQVYFNRILLQVYICLQESLLENTSKTFELVDIFYENFTIITEPTCPFFPL